LTHEARKSDPGDPEGPVSWVPAPVPAEGETGPAGETEPVSDDERWGADIDRFLARLFGRPGGGTAPEPGS
jgi:hypothetical protein